MSITNKGGYCPSQAPINDIPPGQRGAGSAEMTDKHTREPWPQPANIPQTDGTGWWYFGDGMGGGFTEANARRVWACVKACAGITTLRLEEMEGQRLRDLDREMWDPGKSDHQE